MKNATITFFLIALTVCKMIAQNSNYGIYKSWQDYKQGKLSYVINPDSSKGRIKLHHFFSRNYIDIVHGTNKTRLYKDSIFGYRNSKGNDYRFYKNNEKEHQILENKTTVIYTALVPSVSSAGKTTQFVPAYFFSIFLNSEILPLTALNLKRAFPDNLKFHDMLDLAFGDGTSISIYDTEHKMYQVNFLLNKSINK